MAKGTGGTRKHPAQLGLEELNHRVDPDQLAFKTTADLEPLAGVIEQVRAMEALETGLRIRKRNYNIYISGASGTGKSSILKGLLRRAAEKAPPPSDFCLVYCFRRPEAPVVLEFPPGKAVPFRAAMDQFIADLRLEIPKTFHSKNHQERIQRILNEGLESENKNFLELAARAQDIGFVVKRAKEGLVTIPTLEGKPLGNKEYADLTEAQRTEVDANRQRLEPIVSRFLETTRNIELQVHKKIQDAQRALGKSVIDRLIKPLRVAYKAVREDKGFLDKVVEHILDNLQRFLPDESDRRQADRAMKAPMIEYQVNVLVDNSEVSGAPVVFENTPTYHNLVGKIEKRVEHGIYSTDHMMVKAGALLQANGGYLVLHVREVLTYPFAWEALKGVLRHERLVIEEMGEAYQFLPTTGLRPDPIPVHVKVVLIGSNWLYHLLTTQDEDFGKTFQIKAEFDSEVRRSPDALMEYARFVATACKRDELLPVDRDGVAAIIEFGMRQAGSADRMTLRFNEITNLVIEADSLAREAGRRLIRREHVTTAREQRYRRISLMADKSLDDILDGTLKVHTEGTQVGVVNGLALYSYADLLFGRPLRITAKTFHGKAGVLNIEREARLSGNTYNKGVLILSGFLGDRFAQERALGVTVSLTVEQSYGTIDGDSASCAELCSILSALAEAPIRQDLAITGSVSQDGEVQAIGGVNEKVEGFFRICKARGFTGTQGVVLPRANVRHLMLEPEVLEAIRQRQFAVFAVDRVEQALELLTGTPAGERGKDGAWTPGSLYERVAKRLDQYAEKPGRKDGKDRKDDPEVPDGGKKSRPGKRSRKR